MQSCAWCSANQWIRLRVCAPCISAFRSSHLAALGSPSSWGFLKSCIYCPIWNQFEHNWRDDICFGVKYLWRKSVFTRPGLLSTGEISYRETMSCLRALLYSQPQHYLKSLSLTLFLGPCIHTLWTEQKLPAFCFCILYFFHLSCATFTFLSFPQSPPKQRPARTNALWELPVPIICTAQRASHLLQLPEKQWWSIVSVISTPPVCAL